MCTPGRPGATAPDTIDEQVGSVQLAMGEGIAGWVAKNAQPAVVPDKWKDGRYRYIPELRGQDFTSMVSVPMLARGRVVGVLNVHSRAARSYGTGHQRLEGCQRAGVHERRQRLLCVQERPLRGIAEPV